MEEAILKDFQTCAIHKYARQGRMNENYKMPFFKKLTNYQSKIEQGC
jgi:hypothetical protein